MLKTAIFILLLIPSIVFSQEFTAAEATYLSIYFELQKMKMSIDEKVKEIDLKIEKNNERIQKLNSLLAEIQKIKVTGDETQKRNAIEAEPVAQQALITAKQTYNQLNRIRLELQMELDRINIEEENLRNIYKKMKSPKTSGIIKNCQGDVTLITNSNKQQNACQKYSILNEGDIIITGSDGKAEAIILDGRGKVVIGPNSKLTVIKNSPEEQVTEVANGKMYVDIEDKNKFSNKIREVVDAYRSDLKTIINWTDEKIEEIKKKSKEKFKEFKIWWCRELSGRKGATLLLNDSFEGRCGGPLDAILGVRGTKFVYEVDEEIAKISVLEGSVDVTLVNKNMQTFLISEGNEFIIKADGTIHQNKIYSVEKWWSD